MMKFRQSHKLHQLVSLLIILIFQTVYCKAQSDFVQDSLAPKIKFEHDTIDYGVILRNSDPCRYIKLTNVGKEPVLLTNVFSDVVTVVSYPHEPILPGQSKEIKINYPTEKIGRFINFVAISSNTYPSQKIIYVRGVVLPEDSEALKPK